MATFDSPTDVVAGSLAKSSTINNLDAAIVAAFALLPTNLAINSGAVNYAVDTGVTNAYAVALPMVPTSYTDGLLVVMRALSANTGASTVNVNGLGVKSIMNEANAALSANDIVAGIPVTLRYSLATGNFHLIGNATVASASSAASAAAAAASAAAALVSQNAAAGSQVAAAASAAAAAGVVSAHESTYSHANYNTAYGWGNHASAGYALAGQTFYLGTTQVAINRASAALTLAGITLTTPSITGSLTVDDAAWLGLGTAKGRIQFDDEAIDTISLLGANVGIGTATPGAKLHVHESTDIALVLKISNDYNRDVYINFQYDSDGTPVNQYVGIDDPTGNLFLGPTVSSVVVSQSGNVGIGTTGGLAKLSINGGLHVGGDSDPGDNNLLVDGTIHSDGAATLASIVCEGTLTVATKVLTVADTASISGTNTGDVTVSAPISITGQAISLKNNAGSPATITAIDIGTPASSDTVIPTSKAIKDYVDAKAVGLRVADLPVVAATTPAGGNLDLSGTETIDGVSVVADNRVLVKNQTDPTENGIYLCKAGAWERTTDADAWDEFVTLYVWVSSGGTVNGSSGWYCTVATGGTLGVTAIPFAQFSQAAALAAHALDGASHTVSGLTTGHFLKATGANTFAFAAHGLTYTDVGAEVSGATATHAALTTGIHGVGAGTIAKTADITATKLDDFATPDNNTDLNANTTNHGLLLIATAPAAGLTNVVAIENGETVYKNKALYDATAPSTQAFGDSAAAGSATTAARRDHKHAMMAAPTSVSGNAGTVTNATFTTAFTNQGGAGVLAWPAAGATLTIPTGGGTLGTAAFTAATAYDAAGTGAAAASSAVSTHAALITGVHGLVFTAGKTLTLTESLTLNALPVGGLAVATSANVLGSLAVGTVGQYLSGAGAGTVPAWATLNQAAVAGLTTASSPTFAGMTLNGTLVLGANSITLSGSIGATGARVTKGWFTSLECTNAIDGSITGNAATATTATTATNLSGGTVSATTIAASGTLTLTSTGVLHGMTSILPTDAYGKLSVSLAGAGGLEVTGASDSATMSGLYLNALIGVADPDDSTPAMKLNTGRANGTTWAALSASDTAFQLANYTTPLLTIKGDGTATFAGQLDFTTAHGTTLLIDHIGEHTGAHGVIVDNYLYVDHIEEKTASHSVAVTSKLSVGTQSTTAQLSVSAPNGTPVLYLQTEDIDLNPNYLVSQAKTGTADASATTLWSDTPTNLGVTYYIAHVLAYDYTSGTAGAAYTVHAAVYRSGATVTFISGSPGKSFTSESASGYDATFDISGTSVRLRVTGIAATSVSWHVTVSEQFADTGA